LIAFRCWCFEQPAFASVLSIHLVHWSFVRLPLISPFLTIGVPSILAL
jgi:hypothetical protein